MSKSKRITITIHDGIDEATALRKATYLVECSPGRENNIYWKDGTAAAFSATANGTAIHIWKSDLYEIFKDNTKQNENR